MPGQGAPRLRTIQAAVLRQPGAVLTIEDLELEGPRDDEVLVRIVASGICLTNIGFCEGGTPGPAVLGTKGRAPEKRLAGRSRVSRVVTMPGPRIDRRLGNLSRPRR